MAFTLGNQPHAGPDINKYFHTAMLYDINRLRAVMEGKDNSLPQSVAMMALQFKKPMIDAAKEGLKQPPAPSVKDQLLAESAPQQAMPAQGMPQQGGGQLPENSGIAQLPAPNLQGMGHAGGGIIAFDDGGEVPRFKEQGAVSDPASVKEEYNRQLKSGLYDTAEAAWEATKRLFGFTPGWQERFDKTPMEDKGGMMPHEQRDPTTGVYPSNMVAPSAAPAAAAASAAPVEPMARDYTGLGMAGTIPKPIADKKEGADKKGKEGSRSGVSRERDKDVGIGNLKVPTAEGRTAPADLQSLTNQVEGASGLAALKAGQTEIDALREAAQKREIGDFAKRPQHKPYEQYEKSLQEERAQEPKDKEEAFNMALVNAGLAIMGGKSQYAMQNIAEGAQVGTRQYAEATKDLKKAAKERNKELSLIEEARAAYGEKDFDKYQSLLGKHEAAKIASKEHSIDAIQKLTGESAKIAGDIYRTQETNASNERQQLMQAQSAANVANIHGQYGVKQAGMYAGARGATANPSNIAADNAEKAYANWLSTQAGTMAKPEAAEAQRRRFYQEAFRMQGLSDPYAGGGGGSPGVSSGPPPGTVVEGYRFKGGNPNDKSNWEPAK